MAALLKRNPAPRRAEVPQLAQLAALTVIQVMRPVHQSFLLLPLMELLLKVKITSVKSSVSASSNSTSAKTRKRKSKMEATLEVFANKITTAFKNEENDLLKCKQLSMSMIAKCTLCYHSSWRDQDMVHGQPTTRHQCNSLRCPTQDILLLNSLHCFLWLQLHLRPSLCPFSKI